MDKLRKVARLKFQREFEHIQLTVKSELRRQHASDPQVISQRRAQILGLFIGVCAARLNLSAEALAASAGLSAAQVETLLRGEFAADQFTDELLARLADSVQYDVRLLRLMLGRPSDEHAAT